jgi:hypothetical protein
MFLLVSLLSKKLAGFDEETDLNLHAGRWLVQKSKERL